VRTVKSDFNKCSDKSCIPSYSLSTPPILLSLAFLLLVSLTHNSLLHSITLNFNYSRVGGCIIFSSFVFGFSVSITSSSSIPSLPITSKLASISLRSYQPGNFPSYLFGPGAFSHPGTWIFRYSPFCSFPACRILSSVFSAPTSTGRSAAWEPRSVLSHCLFVCELGVAVAVGMFPFWFWTVVKRWKRKWRGGE
jgi:hypothetical protein